MSILLFGLPLHFCMVLQGQYSCVSFCELAVPILLSSVNYVRLSEFCVMCKKRQRLSAEPLSCIFVIIWPHYCLTLFLYAFDIPD